jgi:hydroxymethylglutaryl-CoA lyase
LSSRVFLNEVGLRDGLQAQPKHLTVAERCQLMDSLLACGVSTIEAGSFVSPKAVPQMAGTDEVLGYGLEKASASRFNVLVPNRKGYELAVAAGAREVNLVVSATDTMNQKNINMSTAQIMAVCEGVIESAKQEGVRVNAYVAVAFECPFEGGVDSGQVISLSQRLLAYGADRAVIADTIGAASPFQVSRLFREMCRGIQPDRLACHFHDTRAMGVANVYAAIEQGIRHFDSSIGGLGGCPFAPGASGNVATEDIALLCHQEGLDTGINFAAMVEAVELVKQLTGTAKGGRAYYWLSTHMERFTEKKGEVA